MDHKAEWNEFKVSSLLNNFKYLTKNNLYFKFKGKIQQSIQRRC